MMRQYEQTVSPAGQLRRLLNDEGIISMAACFDALLPKLIQAVGFRAIFMSGFGVSATLLGLPAYRVDFLQRNRGFRPQYLQCLTKRFLIDQEFQIAHGVRLPGKSGWPRRRPLLPGIAILL